MPDLSGIADPAQRDRAKAEIAKVQKVFTAEQLFSGVLILKSLDVAMDWKTGKQVYFVRESQTGWLIAYVSRQQPVR